MIEDTFSTVKFLGSKKSISLELDETLVISFTTQEVKKNYLNISPDEHLNFLENQCLTLSGDIIISYIFKGEDVIKNWLNEYLKKQNIQGNISQIQLFNDITSKFISWQNFDIADLKEYLTENYYNHITLTKIKKENVKINDHQRTLDLALKGVKEAQFNIGLNYAKGEWVKQDRLVSLEWMKKSAEQGYPAANYACGYDYYYGEHIEKDFHLAFTYFERGAKLDDNWSQYYLGVMYANGQGTIKDKVNAYCWYNISYSNGNETAGNYREKIAVNMSVQELENAQNLTREMLDIINGNKT